MNISVDTTTRIPLYIRLRWRAIKLLAGSMPIAINLRIIKGILTIGKEQRYGLLLNNRIIGSPPIPALIVDTPEGGWVMFEVPHTDFIVGMGRKDAIAFAEDILQACAKGGGSRYTDRVELA
jgi:hypothetical protein